MLESDLSDEQVKYWHDFVKEFSLAELRYAFENWARNNRFFPRPSDVRQLCEAYRLSIPDPVEGLPVGCHRCDWSGWYETKGKTANGNLPTAGERVMAPCPCRTNVSLREPCDKKLATKEEIIDMWRQIKQLAADKSMDNAKPKIHVAASSRELAAVLDRLPAEHPWRVEQRKKAG